MLRLQCKNGWRGIFDLFFVFTSCSAYVDVHGSCKGFQGSFQDRKRCILMKSCSANLVAFLENEDIFFLRKECVKYKLSPRRPDNYIPKDGDRLYLFQDIY